MSSQQVFSASWSYLLGLNKRPPLPPSSRRGHFGMRSAHSLEVTTQSRRQYPDRASTGTHHWSLRGMIVVEQIENEAALPEDSVLRRGVE